MAERRIRLLISGRVQGVCFRAATREEAQRLGLKGTVRNLADGRVEILAEGEEEPLQSLEAFCRRGPPFALVRGMERREEPAGAPPLPPFRIAT